MAIITNQTGQDIADAINNLTLDSTWKNHVWEQIYPIGSIYTRLDSTNPSDIFGGTWEEVSLGPEVVEQSGTNLKWYRKWNNGWLEQGGQVGKMSGGWGRTTVTMAVAYENTNYMVSAIGNWSDPGSSSAYVDQKAVGSFRVYHASNNSQQYGSWYTAGYITPPAKTKWSWKRIA